MTAAEAMTVYRRMYLLTLGSAAFVDHRDPAGATASSRAALAALDPQEFPVLSAGLPDVLPALTDHEVYYGALRQLIEAARPALPDQPSPPVQPSPPAPPAPPAT